MKLAYQKMNILLVDEVATALDTLKGILEDFQFRRTWTAQASGDALHYLEKALIQKGKCLSNQTHFSCKWP